MQWVGRFCLAGLAFAIPFLILVIGFVSRTTWSSSVAFVLFGLALAFGVSILSPRVSAAMKGGWGRHFVFLFIAAGAPLTYLLFVSEWAPLLAKTVRLGGWDEAQMATAWGLALVGLLVAGMIGLRFAPPIRDLVRDWHEAGRAIGIRQEGSRQ